MTTRRHPVFVDSNILVYAYDPGNRRKQAIARAVLQTLAAGSNGALGVQVLGEFFRVVTQRIPVPLSQAEAQQRLAVFVRTWPLFDTTALAILEGARAVGAYQLGVWDAVIWATAKLNGALYLLSEDMGDGRLVEGVRILNPLLPSFDMSILS